MNKIDKSPCITIINNVRSVNHWFFAIMCPLTTVKYSQIKYLKRKQHYSDSSFNKSLDILCQGFTTFCDPCLLLYYCIRLRPILLSSTFQVNKIQKLNILAVNCWLISVITLIIIFISFFVSITLTLFLFWRFLLLPTKGTRRLLFSINFQL